MKKYFRITPLILQKLIWIPTKLFFKLFYHIEVKGMKNIKGLNKGVIFASNHSSELDPIIIPSSLPFLSKLMPMYYVSQKKSFYNKRKYIYGGRFFKIWGAYPVNSGKNNYQIALAKHMTILADKNSLCIFPEGEKTTKLDLNKVKGGVAYLCHKSNFPILPVRIKFLRSKRKIVVIFGKALYVKDIFSNYPEVMLSNQQDDYQKAARYLMSKIYLLDKNE